MARIQLRNICKRFGGVEAIRNVSLDIEDRELAVCVGPSGCGKSTLLRLVAGLEELTSGEILIDGKTVNHVPPARRGVAMVFQSYALYPHMTVLENMSFSLRLAGVARKEREQKAREAARVLQIEPLLERKPRELSGGQRQRVAIGRAMVRNPRVFLFDEPLSNLDAALRVQMRLEIMRLHERLESTMIYVTHDQVEAMTMADRIVVLQGGVVEQVGSPLELYHRPRNLFVAGFIGSPRMNFIPAVVTCVGESGSLVTLPGGRAIEVQVAPGAVRPDERVSFGIRPENLSLGDGGLLAGEIVVSEQLGSKTILHVQIEGGSMLAVEAAGGYPARVHDLVRLELNREAIHLFNQAGDAIRIRPVPSHPEIPSRTRPSV